MASNTIKTRIQLKCDTEANWNKSVLVSEGGVEKTTGTSFIPREGEVIIYKADDTHPFSRLKVGDGVTNVVRLPFIDSGSIGNIVLKETFSSFPAIGNQNMLYIEVASNKIYNWTPANGYAVKYKFETQSISNITNWDAGVMTSLSLDTNSPTLIVQNGTAPTLQLQNIDVIVGFG